MCPVKEPHFFLFDGPERSPFSDPADALRAREMIQSWKRYQALFSGKPPGKVAGEASVRYLYSQQACSAIRNRIPDCKLIVVLRQPADRAFSAYQRDRLNRAAKYASFQEALAQGLEREKAGCFVGIYEKLGFYTRHLKPYLAQFPADQVKVLLHDDLVADSASLMAELYRYLGIDDTFQTDLSKRYNETGGVITNPLYRWLWDGTRELRSHILPYVPSGLRGRMFNRVAELRKFKPVDKPGFDPTERAQLTEIYREDILELQDLIQRDLTHWLEPN